MARKIIELNPPYFDLEEQEIIESIDLDANKNTDPVELEQLRKSIQKAARYTLKSMQK